VVKKAAGVALVIGLVVGLVVARNRGEEPTRRGYAEMLLRELHKGGSGRVNIVGASIVVTASSEDCAWFESTVRRLAAESPPRQRVRCETGVRTAWKLEELAGSMGTW
jgi:hypothetical protein